MKDLKKQKASARTLREYLCDIIENNTEQKAFGCISCDVDESHIIFKDDNNTIFLNEIVEFISKYVLSQYNLAHNEIGDCCGCFTIIDDYGIIKCNECGKSLHESISAMLAFHTEASKDMYPREFINWLSSKSIDYRRGMYYSDTDNGVREFTLSDLYQYWQTNIQGKIEIS